MKFYIKALLLHDKRIVPGHLNGPAFLFHNGLTRPFFKGVQSLPNYHLILQLLKKYTVHFLLIVFALQILNMSMHARPMGDDLLIEQSLANPADHAIEYLATTVFHKKDAFPEKHGTPHRRHPVQIHKTISFKLFSSNCSAPLQALYGSVIYSSWPSLNENSLPFVVEINPPPPKA